MKRFYLLTLTFLFSKNLFFAQNSLQNAYAFHDSIVSSKFLGINNGTIFRDFFNTKSKEKEHIFLNNNTFQLGSVFYDNQLYFDVLLRYDLLNDNVIIKIIYENYFSILKLEKDKIRSFSINNSFFVDPSFFKKRGITSENCFYEKLLLSKQFSLFKTSKKIRSEYITENKLYNKFFLVEEFYLLYNNKLHLIESKRDLKKILPNYKTKVYTFYRENKKLFKKNKTTFYKLLIESLKKN